MKQATVKTLGAAALGATLAATGAGTAEAATDSFSETAKTLPAETLPGEMPSSAAATQVGKDMLGMAAESLPLAPATDLLSALTSGGSFSQSQELGGTENSGLLGGLPVGSTLPVG